MILKLIWNLVGMRAWLFTKDMKILMTMMVLHAIYVRYVVYDHVDCDIHSCINQCACAG